MLSPHEQVRNLVDNVLTPQVTALAQRAIDNAAAEFQMKTDKLFKEINERIMAIHGVTEGSCKPVYDGLQVQFNTNILYTPDPTEETSDVL